MELHAYTKSITDILSVNKKYVVPRFQREYSWRKEQVLELWDDILMNIKISRKGDISNVEYFIGALVLVGEDTSIDMQIVDGQQRLTTITIMLSALCQTFIDVGEDAAATALYDQHIEGKDADNRPYFKLINETPKPFFQRAIQFKKKEKLIASSNEEKTLLETYEELYRLMSLSSLKGTISDFNKLGTDDKVRHIGFLKILRDQILRFLKVIYITVKEEDDAYTIFETLNARGMSLSAVDLVKNVIFKELNQQHPDDYAKTEWEKIKERLATRKENVRIDTFFRHFWLSKYSFTSEGRIYKSFRKLMKDNGLDANQFLKELVYNSSLYAKIVNPQQADWAPIEEREIFSSLQALNLFKVTQTRAIILALLRKRRDKLIALKQLIRILKNLENFHFMFTAVCSSRASGIEGKYSRTARNIEEASTKAETHAELKELTKFLKDKLPTVAVFTQNLQKLWFTNDHDKDKKLIQYFFNQYEQSLRETDEHGNFKFTLEHIHPQSDDANFSVGHIGNLIPLDKGINRDVDTKGLKDKLRLYGKSELKTVKEFILKAKGSPSWTAESIDARTSDLAKYSYDSIFIIS